MKARWKRGAVLLQTLVMAVTLSMIAVMVMKWVLARYLLAARNYRATEAKSRAQLVTDDRFSMWNPWNPAYTELKYIPTTGSFVTPDGKAVGYRRTTVGGNGMMEFEVTTDQDQ